MTIQAIPVIALAAISGFVGLFFVFVFFRNQNYPRSGSFGLVCLAIVLYDIGCIGLYNSQTIETSAHWQRLQFAAIAALTASLSLFYRKLTGGFSRFSLVAITTACLAFAVVGITVENEWTLTPDAAAVKHITLGGLLNITYLEAQPGIIYNLQILFSLAVYTICIVGLIQHRRSSGRSKSSAIGTAMIIFYFATVNDALVGIGLYPFIYCMEYAFAGFIIAMTATFVKDFLDLHEEVSTMNLMLEKTVEKRTKQIKILSGLLPICASCKKIRDDKGYWNQIESYIKAHADVNFSHGICPECRKALYPELEDTNENGHKR